MPTKIEWATETWNPVTGCTPVSEACQNCYAKRMANRLRGRFGYPEDEPFRVTLHPEKLGEPLRWKKPRRVFVCSMGDLFHEDVPDKIIYKIFEIMANAQWIHGHTFMVLTKRPQRMKYIIDAISRDISNQKGMKFSFPLKNIWLGVTAENQKRADERIPILLQIPAAVRFISIEPMLGPVDLTCIIIDPAHGIEFFGGTVTYSISANVLRGKQFLNGLGGVITKDYKRIDWVICGGETGPKARPMHPEWVRSLRDQCQAAGTPFFFKQWGEWAPIPTKDVPVIGCADGGRFHDGPNPSRGLAMYRVGKKAAGNLIDGQEWRKFPEVS